MGKILHITKCIRAPVKQAWTQWMMTEAVVRNDIMKHFLSAAACVSKSNSNKKNHWLRYLWYWKNRSPKRFRDYFCCSKIIHLLKESMAESGCKWNTIHTCNYAKCDCSFLSGSCVLEKENQVCCYTLFFFSVCSCKYWETAKKKQRRKNYKEKKQEENCMLNVDFFPYSH